MALRLVSPPPRVTNAVLRMIGAAAGAMTGAINETGEGKTWLWQMVGRALQPFFRLIGGKHRVWPPSKQSAPLIILGWALLTSPLFFLMRTPWLPRLLAALRPAATVAAEWCAATAASAAQVNAATAMWSWLKNVGASTLCLPSRILLRTNG
jgi:hypothetical protein